MALDVPGIDLAVLGAAEDLPLVIVDRELGRRAIDAYAWPEYVSDPGDRRFEANEEVFENGFRSGGRRRSR